MRVTDFDYYLPEELIAQEPIKRRDMSRLLVLHRATGAIEHRVFRDILAYLRAGDVLVINETRVLPARLYGVREGTGAQVELLLLERREGGAETWEVLVKPGKKARPGAVIVFGDGELKATVLDTTPDGGRIVEFVCDGDFREVLGRLGKMPVPPYVKKELMEAERYQTVYAREEGSAAAPTAGLHFTPELMEEIRAMGVTTAPVLLHVGLGTFRPVAADEVEEHVMHREYYEIGPETAEAVNRAKREGRRVIAVGTTSVRALETAAAAVAAEAAGEAAAEAARAVTPGGGTDGASGPRGSAPGTEVLRPGKGWSQIFIYPGFQFRVIDALLTNFHLPKSTLLMLVSALAGRDKVMDAYREAVEEEYRFFSFGDAMLIL